LAGVDAVGSAGAGAAVPAAGVVPGVAAGVAELLGVAAGAGAGFDALAFAAAAAFRRSIMLCPCAAEPANMPMTKIVQRVLRGRIVFLMAQNHTASGRELSPLLAPPSEVFGNPLRTYLAHGLGMAGAGISTARAWIVSPRLTPGAEGWLRSWIDLFQVRQGRGRSREQHTGAHCGGRFSCPDT
jgi:hypothetical protein